MCKNLTTRISRADGADPEFFLGFAPRALLAMMARFFAEMTDVVERVDVGAAAAQPFEADEEEDKSDTPIDACRGWNRWRGVLWGGEDEPGGLEG